MTVRVLIADDQPLMRTGFRMILDAEPDLAVVGATRRLAGEGIQDPVRVLILTTFDLDEYVLSALRAGASGFLLKDAPPEDLVDAIKVVAAGSGSLEAKRSSRRRVTEGARRASPAATTLMASTRSSGGTSLSRNPLAPARNAS